jgi:acetyl-CoA acetyltransferase
MALDSAIVGLGMTEMGKVYGVSAEELASDAIALALDDAGLSKGDLDGLLINSNMSSEMAPTLQMALGLEDLGLIAGMTTYGATVGSMLQFADAAIAAGNANVIALVYADVPMKQGGSISKTSSYAGTALPQQPGINGLRYTYGNIGSGTIEYAMAARRHMHEYGTTSEQLGHIAVAQRAWAQMNPRAQMNGRPLSLEEYHDSRLVVDPLHLFDCCLVSNGAIAVIVTSAERAAQLRQPPVNILGIGHGAPGDNWRKGRDPGVITGAVTAGPAALRAAGVELADIDVAQIYDCYTYTVLVTLEDYGYCGKGEGGAFVEDGKLSPGGGLPINTGGGQLSSYYMWGFTPLSEGVLQARGQAGERQVDKHELVLVSGNGGNLNWHSTTVLGASAS